MTVNNKLALVQAKYNCCEDKYWENDWDVCSFDDFPDNISFDEFLGA